MLKLTISANSVAMMKYTRFMPIGIAPLVMIMTTMKVGMNVMMNDTTWLPE